MIKNPFRELERLWYQAKDTGEEFTARRLEIDPETWKEVQKDYIAFQGNFYMNSFGDFLYRDNWLVKVIHHTPELEPPTTFPTDGHDMTREPVFTGPIPHIALGACKKNERWVYFDREDVHVSFT